MLSDFLSLFFEHNIPAMDRNGRDVVNCFQIFYLCSSNTTLPNTASLKPGCELLSDFLSLFFEHNAPVVWYSSSSVVNCFQIFYLCSSNTTLIQLRNSWVSCELLSDFLSLFFEHNHKISSALRASVVNCFQIFYLCSSNTTIYIRRLETISL